MSSLVIKIANRRGANDPTGTESFSGHMWFSLINDAGNSYDYGFHPLHAGNSGLDPRNPEIGKVHDNDSAYYTTVDSSTALTLNAEQFSKLQTWADNTVTNGWGNYNGLNNNCIDYAWAALTAAGINQNPSYEGEPWPSVNNSHVKEVMYDYYRHARYNKEGKQGSNTLDSFFQKVYNAFQNANEIVSPLILDLNGDGVKTLSIDYGVKFDHDNNGLAQATGWVDTQDGLLVFDQNNNGLIDNGSELFGNHTLNTTGTIITTSDNGFIALQSFDTNKDGKVDIND
jgi:hypothetical protein